MDKQKLLVFGIDGATFDVILPAIKKGKLPHLQRLMESGSWGRMKSTIHPLTPMAWTSFSTGVNAAKHGIYDFARLDQNRVVLNCGLDRKAPALWTHMTQARRPSIVLNVPFTYPPEQINGIMIPGFEAPQVNRGVFHPESIYDEMIEKFGSYGFDWTFPIGQKLDVDAYVEHSRKTIDHRGETSLHLLKNHPWDFFMVVFSTPDHVQHIFWRYPGGQEVIEDCYAQCDKWLGRYLEAIDDDVTVVVGSDHGFGPIESIVYLDNWLEQEGYLKRAKHNVSGSLVHTAKNTLRKILPTKLRKLVAFKFANLKGRLEAMEHANSIDWTQTKAYSYGMYGSIYINLKGRAPEGIVDPADFNSLCDEITKKLFALRDPKSGQPVVDKVHRKEDLYSGPYQDQAPDLVVQWRDYAYYTKHGLDQGKAIFGDTLSIEASEFPHTGTHRLAGVFIASGPNIKHQEEIDATIYDVAPTVLQVMGHAVPKEMDGRVLNEIFENPPEKDAAGWQPDESQAESIQAGAMKEMVELSESDEENVRERLRSLGYIE